MNKIKHYRRQNAPSTRGLKLNMGKLMTIPFEELINIGWTKWEGGECPVAPGTFVRLRLDDYDAWREKVTNTPELYEWANASPIRRKIIAYQVLELGRTVEGDPIIAGGVYETRGGDVIGIVGRSSQGAKPILDNDGDRYHIDGRFLQGRTDEFDIMRLRRPKQTFTVTVDGKEVRVGKEKLDKIKQIVGGDYLADIIVGEIRQAVDK